MARYTEHIGNRITRSYGKEQVLISYTKDDVNKSIFVHLVSSVNKGKGNARFAFTHFVAEHQYDYDIEVRITDELGADLNKLFEFYSKQGFRKHRPLENGAIYKKLKKKRPKLR